SLPASLLSSPHFLESCIMVASNSPYRRSILDTPTPHGIVRHSSKSPPATARRSSNLLQPGAPYAVKPKSTFGKFTPLRKAHTTIPHTTSVLGLSHRNELNRRKSGLSKRTSFLPDP